MSDNSSEGSLFNTLSSCKRFLLTSAFFSFFINILMLAPPLYMLQVYDRVITSQSFDTLLMLTLLLVFLFFVMYGLEVVRSRLLVRLGNRFDKLISPDVFEAMFYQGIHRPWKSSAQPLNDLSNLRQFLSGNGLFAFFDAPWTPVYIAILFCFDAWLGVFSLCAGLILLGLAVANELSTRNLLADASNKQVGSQKLANSNLRNSEVLYAMGMMPGIKKRWSVHHHEFLANQSLASDRAGVLSNVSKVTRLLAQSLILGLGALLVLKGDLTPGMMIAGSILMGRALSPIDQAIAAWKHLITARTAYSRLKSLFEATPVSSSRMSLPPPKGEVRVENVVASPPGTSSVALKGFNFQVSAGEHVGIIGSSGSGKSSLARVLLGIWPTQDGTVRLDDADIRQWNRDELGPYIGYLPQNIELFDGTIGENIARFGEVDSQKVVAAAKMAGVHDMILHQPDGYDTNLESSAGALSGGQRQRIGLARALYGDPVLVILDEPNASLDDAGEKALISALQDLKSRGTTLFIISHRESILKTADKLLLIHDGKPRLYGSKEDVVRQVMAGQQRMSESEKLSNTKGRAL
ncbi:type I secretion system permease/ATPase [Halomonas caseinilytica]|uniref:type I secretion system permease/ATPase n=1 Tax=Halomonas caseinilytica TaxID=438744 RepID=UPI0008488A28|nr:type I secretion system permease/ATPase [Halomonas caseinilytica]